MHEMQEGVSRAQQEPDTQETNGRKADPQSTQCCVRCKSQGWLDPGLDVQRWPFAVQSWCCPMGFSELCIWGPGPAPAVAQAAAVTVLQGSQSGYKSLTEHGLSSLIGNNLFESFFIKIQME